MRLITITFIHLILISSSYAQSIGINFGSGRANASLDPAAVAGAVPQANWNNAAGTNGTSLVLINEAGEDSGATATWSSNEQWSLGDSLNSTPVEDNATLLNGFISANTDQGTIDITNIPYANYNLYVYMSHDRTAEDVLISEANDAFPPFIAIEQVPNVIAPVTFVQQPITNLVVTGGNYILFSGLTASDLNILFDSNDDALSRGPIAGIQIVEFIPSDLDGDGLEDIWETDNGLDPNDNGLDPNNNGVTGDPNNGAAGDPDGDSLTNLLEQDRGTDPMDPDTDDDNLLDGVESNTGIYVDGNDTGSNPIEQDSDGDTLRDDFENDSGIFVDETNTGTNPNNPDTDGDTINDNVEVDNMLDPTDKGFNPNNNGAAGDPNNGAAGDPDNDTINNIDELTAGTDPQDADSDDDTLNDNVETNTGIYIDTNDTGTNPLNPDTDGDSLLDNLENNSGIFVSQTDTGTNPNMQDSDGDVFSDSWEALNGRNPNEPNDGIANSGSIGLNFGAENTNATIPEIDLAGIAPQANWNNLSSNNGADVALNNELGENTSATISWDLDEATIGSAAADVVDVNGFLLNGWFSANGLAASNTIDISNIPYASYDLVFYLNHDRANEDVLITESNGAFDDFLAREINTDISQAITFSQQLLSAEGDDSQAGNFAVIPNLTSSTLNLVLDGGAPGPDGRGTRGAISGIQIINRGPGARLQITDCTTDPVAGVVTLTWNSAAGLRYAIDASSDLIFTDVSEIAEVDSQGAVTSFTEDVNFSSTQKRFYRVRELSTDN